MKEVATDTISQLEAGVPINKLKKRHLEYVQFRHERYLWDDEDYKLNQGDMLYCIIEQNLVPIPMDSLLLIGWYEHTTLRSTKIPGAANFYVHKPTGTVYILPRFDLEEYCLALPYPCSAEAAMNFIESGNDLYATYRQNYKAYVIANRKCKIDNLFSESE